MQREELTSVKTLQEIAVWLEDRNLGDGRARTLRELAYTLQCPEGIAFMLNEYRDAMELCIQNDIHNKETDRPDELIEAEDINADHLQEEKLRARIVTYVEAMKADLHKEQEFCKATEYQLVQLVNYQNRIHARYFLLILLILGGFSAAGLVAYFS